MIGALIARRDINGFYESVEARGACCETRKAEPLNRALCNAAGWVTGIRADQSKNGNATRFIEVDKAGWLLEVNPLLDWSREQAQAYAAAHGVQRNTLHEEGFASIACAPCTRAIAPGEDGQDGRWWREEENQKECGLHSS